VIILYTAIIAFILVLTIGSIVMTAFFSASELDWQAVKAEKEERWLIPLFLICRIWIILLVTSAFIGASYGLARLIFGG
jgi:hypothetical protein